MDHNPHDDEFKFCYLEPPKLYPGFKINFIDTLILDEQSSIDLDCDIKQVIINGLSVYRREELLESIASCKAFKEEKIELTSKIDELKKELEARADDSAEMKL